MVGGWGEEFTSRNLMIERNSPGRISRASPSCLQLDERDSSTGVTCEYCEKNFKKFCLLNISLVAASVSAHSSISFKPFTSSNINVASDLSKIGNFLIEDWGKLANLRKPIRVIRFSDKYDLRFEDRGFDVKLLLEVALLFELELLTEVELLFELELLFDLELLEV